MTIEINLLPWRERQRERRSRRFYVAMALVAVLGMVGGLGMTYHYQEALSAQEQRNTHVREEIQGLEGDIRSISEYEAIRERMIGQIEVFSELQRGRSQTVEVFRDLATSLVGGVHYTELSRQDSRLRLSGRAESNHQVSDQLRGLSAASSLSEPVLSEVEADGGARRRFSLSVIQLAGQSSGPEEEAP